MSGGRTVLVREIERGSGGGPVAFPVMQVNANGPARILAASIHSRTAGELQRLALLAHGIALLALQKYRLISVTSIMPLYVPPHQRRKSARATTVLTNP